MSNENTISNVHKHTVEETKKLLRAVPWKIPTFIWGAPGLGKTDVVNQVAAEDGADVIVLKASEMRPEDLAGLPDLMPEGYTEFRPPRALWDLTVDAYDQLKEEFEAKKASGELPEDAEFEEPGPVYLFLDEFSNAQPDMVAPFQYLTLNRMVGGMNSSRLRDNVRIIAAGNREHDGAFANSLSTPLKSRFFHMTFEPTLDEWVSWARANGVYPNIISFLKTREKYFHDFDPKTNDLTFPCPRTWAELSEVLKGLDAHGIDDPHLRRIASEDAVGPAAAMEYSKFETTVIRAPSAEEIVEKPNEIETFDDDPALAMVCVENLIAAIRRAGTLMLLSSEGDEQGVNHVRMEVGDRGALSGLRVAPDGTEYTIEIGRVSRPGMSWSERRRGNQQCSVQLQLADDASLRGSMECRRGTYPISANLF